ncbi:DUF6891 domain-containing protein [Microbacterium gorillae]|uniref:DUF6891 domain-containing protein n=1 Tax=Microbacterium gorillae TaxID=1231063 RepID=UPI003D96C0FC
MERITNAQPEDLKLPLGGLAAELEAEVRDAAWSQVVRGETDPELFVELYEDELAEWDIAKDVAIAAFNHVVAARRAQQAAWPADAHTNLTDAFEALNRAGIVARENFSCCGSCAAAEIWDERDDSRSSRGYVTYNQQDTEQLIERQRVYVSYGAFWDAWIAESEWTDLSDEARESAYADIVIKLMIEEVVPVFEKRGITVTWNRDLGTRILLENADFAVRLSGMSDT